MTAYFNQNRALYSFIGGRKSLTSTVVLDAIDAVNDTVLSLGHGMLQYMPVFQIYWKK